jgi:1-acyl-sn-glycerol-3-phosphate acyltransferase
MNGNAAAENRVMPSEEKSREQALLALVGGLVRELHAGGAGAAGLSLASRLDRDLGIDSLGRSELILRVESAFGVRLPPATLSEADTIGDLLAALRQAAPSIREAPSVVPVELPAAPHAAAPAQAQTLVDVLEWHAANHPDRMHLTVLEDEATVIGSLTYAQLAEAARTVASGLIARDVVPGDRIALMLPTGIDFFAAFFGILYAGAVPVPIYPPARLSQVEEHMNRQAGILRNAGVRILVTVPEALGLASMLRGQVESLALVESVAALTANAQPLQLPSITSGEATAFIQYTSGSTGDPKGVILSHANLLANIRALGAAVEATSADVFVSWLPLYHDLGLIGGWLGSLYFAASFYVMSPLSFLRRPATWLRAMHRYRATLSAAPNFAFELCVTKVDAADIEGVDLSALRLVANGAEPVSVQTLRSFTERFAHYGFKPGAMAPGYGLAENTVVLTLPPLGRPPLIDRVDRDALSRRGVATPARADDPKALEIVSCGRVLPDHEIRVIGEGGRVLDERHEGRLEFRGPSATSGYFRNETKTRELFHDGWLDTGDQAYIAGGEVFVTGRIKDIIIRAGRHIYPQEIEEAVAGIAGILKTGVAVFGMSDPATGTERTIVLAETAEADPGRRAALQARAREVATDILGAPPDEVVLAPPQTVPKTSSGKIRRSAARDLYESGAIGQPQRSVRWQLLRLFLAGALGRVAQFGRAVGAFLYAAWWWLVVSLTCVIAWIAVMVLPRLEWRWSAIRIAARVGWCLLGVPVSVAGAENLPREAVFAFNHSSYADVFLLVAVLPDEPAFAAKKELASQIFAGPFLRRLGAHFVDRYDVAASVADTEAVTQASREGRPIVFFPEGTFTARPGVTGFYLGAFKVASKAGLSVVPGIIAGTRTMLRDGSWFPHWTPISVQFAERVQPTGTDFGAVVTLRDKVRNIILANCREPDLGGLAKPAPPPNAGAAKG